MTRNKISHAVQHYLGLVKRSSGLGIGSEMERKRRKNEGWEEIHFKFRGDVQYLLFGAFLPNVQGEENVS